MSVVTSCSQKTQRGGCIYVYDNFSRVESGHQQTNIEVSKLLKDRIGEFTQMRAPKRFLFHNKFCFNGLQLRLRTSDHFSTKVSVVVLAGMVELLRHVFSAYKNLSPERKKPHKSKIGKRSPILAFSNFTETWKQTYAEFVLTAATVCDTRWR